MYCGWTLGKVWKKPLVADDGTSESAMLMMATQNAIGFENNDDFEGKQAARMTLLLLLSILCTRRVQQITVLMHRSVYLGEMCTAGSFRLRGKTHA